MRWLLPELYEFLAAALPLALLLAAAPERSRRCRLALALLVIYLGLVFYVTGPGTLWDGIAHGFRLRPAKINLIPFIRDIAPYRHWARNLALCGLNVVLFVPLGLLVPAVWPAWDRWPRVAGLGAGFSLLIEACQLLNYRFCDVDDVICNALGAALGWALLQGAKKLGLPTLAEEAWWQPPLYLLALSAGHFLLYWPDLARRLAG